MNKNQLRKLRVMGVTLVGASYLLHYNSTALADDIKELPINSFLGNVARNSENVTATSNATLNQAIFEAKQGGIEVVETEVITYTTDNDLQNDYLHQIQTIKSETRLYQEAKQSYNKQLEAYHLNQKEHEQYQKELSHYNQYLKDQETYHQAYSRYQKDNQAYELGLVANKKLEETYQKDLGIYKEQLVAYENDKKAYENSLVANARAKSEYSKLLEQYQSDLKVFEEAQKAYDEAKKREAEQKANYQKELETYNQDLREYELEKAVYDEKIAEAQSNAKKEGYLSQVHAQYLIFKSEPNASVNFENVSEFFNPNHQFGGGLSGIGGKIDDLVLSDKPHLFEGVGAGTAAGAGNGYGVILEKGKPITVIYTGLEKSSYNGRAITKVVYTYELTSTFAADGKATAFIYTDPTKTIYVGTSGNNQGQTDFNIHQTITYYYDDKEKVILAPNTTALLSFASRNNTFEFGEQEYVKMGENMTFIPITGSSVGGEGGYIASRGSNNSMADGSRFNRDDWDKDGHDNEYYGAGVVQVTGDAISFDFGIRYSQADIMKSSNPARLRNGSRQWFTVNSDLKASGILQATLREKPEAPKEPDFDNRLLVAPIKPTEPKEPRYEILVKPVKPIEPQQPTLLTLVKPMEPKAPDNISQPIKPEVVTKPSIPKRPSITFHKAILSPNIKRLSEHVNNDTRAISYNSLTISPRTVTFSNTHHSYSTAYPLVPYQPIKTQVDKISYPVPTRVRTKRVPTTRPVYIKHKHFSDKEMLEKRYGVNLKKAREYYNNIEKRTNMNKEEQDIFFGYLKEVRKHALEKYSNMAELSEKERDNKVNHAIANAIAGVVYSDKKDQQAVNDFNTLNYKQIKGYSKFKTLLTNVATDDTTRENYKYYYIDLPHLAMPLASSYQSSWPKELVKFIMTGTKKDLIPTGIDISDRDIFFWLNSYTGDKITTFGYKNKDLPTDQDAWILHKLYSGNKLYLDQDIKAYYGQDVDREKAYQKALTKGQKSKDAKLMLSVYASIATLSLGAVIINFYVNHRPKLVDAYLKIRKLGGDLTANIFNRLKNIFSGLLPKPKNNGQPKGNPKPKNNGQPKGNPKPKNNGQPKGNPKPKNNGQPKTNPKPKNNGQPKGNPKPKNNEQPKGNPKPKNNGQPKGNPKPKNNGQPKGNPKPKNNGQPKGNPKPKNNGQPKGNPKPKEKNKGR